LKRRKAVRFPPGLKKHLDLAFAHKNRGEYHAAVAVLKAALAEFPSSGVTNWLLGGLYFTHLDDPEQAIPYFAAATRLNPKARSASLGLFHCLWSTDRIADALAEIKRFQVLTGWSCQDYVDIVAEIHGKWLGPTRNKKRTRSRQADKT
jgi:tetratricopeptide (TPR) repeat protein